MLNRLRGGTPQTGRRAGSATAPASTGIESSFSETSSPGVEGERFRLLAITPFEKPDLALARAVSRQQAAAAIDLGRDTASWPALFDSLSREPLFGVGLRVPDGMQAADLESAPGLPDGLSFLLLGDASPQSIRCLPAAWRRLPLIVQVCSTAEALAALDAGASGLIAKGQESGGRTGDESSFVLLQRVLKLVETRMADGGKSIPVWCQGGIGLFTAAGAFAGGAFGVVIDSLLAVYPECSLPASLKAQVLAMDGSDGRLPASQEMPPSTGQDAALARLALAECPNIESLVNALRMRIAGQILQARTLQVLGEGNPWARSHGVRYPVAQGPMTRVSDTAAFAHAVSDAGGLSFLALALMREQEARHLLEATREQVGNRPWGIGVLGFAPPEILEPQLELVRQFRPAALLLAGGRPSQARPFIEMGIPTYLHVPSPGLLESFLSDGITHFIFEGRECGGHVGPRYSFVLWEQALALLTRYERPEQLHVLFAGGIHDERSAAMVAAIAASLAARGARVGVLMGTAYIVTREAVACGSVLQNFQDRVLNGQATVLVETAPGHAIRCLPSGFVDLFQREKERLGNEGLDPKSVWHELEMLTVGRLRIASKGLDYIDGRLTSVDMIRQQAEGMYMIGQAIALADSVITVAELHARVTRGAMQFLSAVHAPALARADNASPVAIVGMACVYPGSSDLESYWANIIEGKDLVSEVPAERWNAELYYQEGASAADRTVSKWGGFIDEQPFDPLRYGIPPQSLGAIEPAQLLALETANRALQDAGYEQRWFDRQKTAVIFGAESAMDLANQYTFRNLYPQYCGPMPESLANALPVLTEDSFPGILVNVISGRIANRLGLGGVNYSVDSACASSLTAIELAVKELRSGSSDMVLAGGADFHNGIADFLLFSSVGALSPRGRCRAFDDRADGICLGEGVGVVVLKRLSDAERDGDRIYAVIDAVAGSSDGKALGLTAPSKEGQKRALERTYWQAGVLPAEVGLVEAHGTGTVVGDRTELRALSEVFYAGGATPAQAGLGSVKSQIGHTKCAAGIAGLIKMAKALHHGVLPPTQLIETPNAGYRRVGSPFLLERLPKPWLGSGRPAAAPMRAAVSAFGFGGTNFHALLSASPQRGCSYGSLQFPAELFAFRGSSLQEAQASMRILADFIAASDESLTLRDLAHGAWESAAGPVHIAFTCADPQQLLQRIAVALEGRREAGIHYRQDTGSGLIACLFTGQGSQYPGMLRELFVYFPQLRDILALGREYLPVLFPPTAYDETSRQQQRRTLTDTRNTQPSLALVELALFQWLSSLGLQPDMAGGHSYGELAALAAAGVFDEATLLSLSRSRAEAMAQASSSCDGTMAAVNLGAGQLEPMLAAHPQVVIANHNGPQQSVVSGGVAEVEAACRHLQSQGVTTRRLETGGAFHSPMMAEAEQGFAAALEMHRLSAMRWPVYSNASASPYDADAGSIRLGLAQQIVRPVRFVEQVLRMHADGARVFIEIGPRRALTSLVRSILGDAPHIAIAVDPEERGLPGLFDSLAQMAVVLPAFDASSLFKGRSLAIDLSRPRRMPATTWMLSGGRARSLNGEAQSRSTPAHSPAATTRAAAVASADQALMAYLINLREMVKAQRDVLVGYFGVEPSATVPSTPASAPVPIKTSSPSGAPALINAARSTAPAAPGVGEVLLDVISRSTGYPPAHLDLDLDLEADLSIDSIKRLEVVGQLASRLGLANGSREKDQLVEKLAPMKTLRAMIAWLDKGAPSSRSIPPSAEPRPVLVDPAHQAGLEAGRAPERYLPVWKEAGCDKSPRISLAGKHFLVTNDRQGVAEYVVRRLRTLDATADLVDFDPASGLSLPGKSIDGLVHLRSMSSESGVNDILPLVMFIRAQLMGGLKHILVGSVAERALVDPVGLPGAAGLTGMLRSLAREFADLRCHGLSLAASDSADTQASRIVEELQAGTPLPEVAWRDGRRVVRVVVSAPLSWDGPVDGPDQLLLDSESVVLITGGARGITAAALLELARKYRCRFEIVGRSPIPKEHESSTTRGITDLQQLRQVLIEEDSARKPAEVERRVRSILAGREMQQTFEAARAAGAGVRYTALDVRDERRFSAHIHDIYDRHGRIDGVIHGAGVIEDRLLRDKTVESFARVFDTKVKAALSLHRHIRSDVRFVVFFSSVSSVFGNRGQVDYAAANDVLDRLADNWNQQIAGRVLAVNWGPWADTGMVNDGIRREYERQGIGLIARQQGVEALIRELSNAAVDPQVVLMCGTPESFMMTAERA